MWTPTPSGAIEDASAAGQDLVQCSTARFTGVAPVAQGIEHRPPEAGAQVRILPGAPHRSHSFNPFGAINVATPKSDCHYLAFVPTFLC